MGLLIIPNYKDKWIFSSMDGFKGLVYAWQVFTTELYPPTPNLS